MKRIVWIIIIIAVIGYFISNYLEDQAKKKADEAEKERIELATKDAVSKMVQQHNASSDWQDKLTRGERIRREKILSIELENLWIPQPILFIGSIQDVSTLDDENYRLEIERDILHNLSHYYFTELKLELSCNKKIFDDLMKENKKLFTDFGFSNGVAFIADISQVKSDFYIDEEGNKKEVRIGIGKCIDLIYIGRVRF